MMSSRPTCSICGSELIGRSLSICPICRDYDPRRNEKPSDADMLDAYQHMASGRGRGVVGWIRLILNLRAYRVVPILVALVPASLVLLAVFDILMHGVRRSIAYQISGWALASSPSEYAMAGLVLAMEVLAPLGLMWFLVTTTVAGCEPRLMQSENQPGYAPPHVRRVARRITQGANVIIALVLLAAAGYCLFRFFAMGLTGHIRSIPIGGNHRSLGVHPIIGALLTLAASIALGVISLFWLGIALNPTLDRPEQSRRALEHELDVVRGICPYCKYDVTGFPDETPCPECGRRRYRDFVPPSALDQ